MKPVLKTSLISFGSAFVGGAVVFAALKYSPFFHSKIETERPSRDAIYDDILKKQEGIQHKFDSLFDDNLFNQNDPFEEMKRMCAFRSNPATDSGGMTATLSGSMAAGYSDGMAATRWSPPESAAVMPME